MYLNDSKQLSEKKREELYDKIMEEAVAVAVGYASPARIDEINILQATYEAMREAISMLSQFRMLLFHKFRLSKEMQRAFRLEQRVLSQK